MNTKHFFRLSTIALATSLFSFAPAFGAGDDVVEIIVEPPVEVERWYAALGGVNRRDFRDLIAEDAIIVLKDLGIEQTKSEFISSLDEWNRATRKANIIYRYEAIEDGTASALVCYRFSSNEKLILESFTYRNEQITGSVQETRGDDCGDM